jgi:hypothetical protein
MPDISTPGPSPSSAQWSVTPSACSSTGTG